MTHAEDFHHKEDVPVWGQEKVIVWAFVMMTIIVLTLWGILFYVFPKLTITISGIGILYFMTRADKDTLQKACVQLEQG
jgi:hypothetical protein